MSTTSADVVPLHGPRRTAAPAVSTLDPHLCRRTSRLLISANTDKALEALFTQADDRLFDMASGGMDDLRSLRKNRALLLRKHRDHIDAIWSRWEKGGLTSPELGANADGSTGLALLEEDDLERQIACNQLALTIGRQHKEILSGLHGALMTIEGRDPAILDPEHILAQDCAPWSPEHLASAFRSALTVAELTTQGELVLYKLYERDLNDAVRKAYHEIGQMFIKQGLPVAAVRARPVTPPRHLNSVPGSEGTGRPGGWNDQVLHEEVANLLDLPNAIPGDVYADPHGRQYTMQDLTNLLGRMRHQNRQASAAQHDNNGAPRPILDSAHAMQVLSWVQHHTTEHAQTQLRMLDEGVSLATQLKQLVLRQAEQLGVAAPGASMSETEEDAIDLVSMLFEVLLSERHVARMAQETMIKMVVPYIRVAVMDKRLFMQKTHPARRLLNTITEACQGNMGETSAEKELLGKVDITVQRIVSEFNEDVAVFETLEQDFRGFFQESSKRAELSERRAAEAQRGQERLLEARIKATDVVQQVLAQHGDIIREMPAVLDLFLRQYWHHHLTVTMLRQGADTPAYQAALDVGQGLMGAFAAARNSQPLPTGVLDSVEGVLMSSGLVGNPARDVRLSIAQALHAVRHGAPDTTPVPAAVQAWASSALSALDSAARSSDQNQATDTPSASTQDIDSTALEQIRTLTVGQWVEIVEKNERQPVKLSWVSPISNKHLFVNKKGLKVCAETPEELAARITSGTLKIWQGEHPFEQAMNQILGKLQASDTPEASRPRA